MKKQILFSALIFSAIGFGLGIVLSFSFINQKEEKLILSQKEFEEKLIHQVNQIQNEKELINHVNTLSDLTYASEKSIQSVVHIQTKFIKEEIHFDPFLKLFYGEDAYQIRKRKGQSSGSGVIISKNGYIVTNNHVVQDAYEINVVIENKKYEGTLIGNDPSTDLAVIKIDENNLSFLEFGDSDELKLGEWVIAVGNPLNLNSTVTAGIVSAKNRNIDLLTSQYNPEKNIFPIESFIQTDAAVNSGNSGGALVNKYGKLVGINTAIASGNGYYTGYSFAIPANIVKKVTADIIQFGKVKRLRLGISLVDNNSEIAIKNNLPSKNGVIVGEVYKDGIGEIIGLKNKDIIIEINHKKITNTSEFQELISLQNPGDKINLKVLRGEIEKTFEFVFE